MADSTKVKICGILDVDTALFCGKQGADFIGLNFSPKSIRKISVSDAKSISNEVSRFNQNKNGSLKIVNLFYGNTESDIRSICNEIKCDYIQLIAGDEELKTHLPDLRIPVILSIGIRKETTEDDLKNFHSGLLILDTYKKGEGGGIGETFDWEMIKDVRRKFFLAGGLNPGNVADAIKLLRPYGVDVASGVESTKGIKDKNKIREFIQNAKRI